MKNVFIFALAIPLALLTGCTTLIQQNPNPRNPVRWPARMLAKTDVTADIPAFEFEKEEDGVREGTVTVGAEILNFEYRRSKLRPEEKHEVVFVYRILNDAGGVVSGMAAGMILDAGFDCIIVKQENFLSKAWVRPVLPDGGKEKSYDEYNAALARGVGRIIYHWIPDQPKLTGRYAFVGISMGGIHAVGAASLFPDAVLTVAIMAGGGNSEIFKGSQESLVIFNRNALIKQYADYLSKKYPGREMGSSETLYRDIEKLDFDIIRAARAVDTRKIKMMISVLLKSW